MPVDEEPPVLLTAADVPRFLEELPVGARAGTSVRCCGTVCSRRRTTAHTFVMLSLVDEAGGGEGRSTAEVQLVLPGAHGAEPAPWCEPYLSPGAELSCCGEPGCDRAESLSVYVTSTSVVLERAAPEPSALARVLDAITGRTWGGTEAAAATALACDQASICQHHPNPNTQSEPQHPAPAPSPSLSPSPGPRQAEVSRLCQLGVDSGERKLALVALSRRLRGLPDAKRPARQRGAHVGASDVAALEAEEAALGASLLAEAHWEPGALGEEGRIGDESCPAERGEGHQPTEVEAAARPLEPTLELTALPCEGEHLASARGPLSRAEYLHGKKRPQILWVLQRVALWDRPPRHILDLGGGRGDLALALAQRHPYATQASNPGLADRVPGSSATHTCEPRLGQGGAGDLRRPQHAQPRLRGGGRHAPRAE